MNPKKDTGAPKMYRHEDNSWFFSSEISDWHSAIKPAPVRKYKEKGLRGVRSNEERTKAFKRANDAMYGEKITWV